MTPLNLSSFGFPRRRSAVCRFLAIVITIALFFLIFAQQNTSAALTSRHPNGIDSIPVLLQQQSQPRDRSTDHTELVPHKERSVENIHERKISHAGHQHQACIQNAGQKVMTDTDSVFMTNFWSTMTLMPSELSMKALMAPFVDTGDEHLKDVATRVRIFRAAFEAWEDLHGVASVDQVGFSNILQRLRNSGNSAVDIRNAIQRYDEFRYYVNRLGITLFPGTNLAFGDHLLLHASFYKAGRGIVLTLGDHQVYMVLTSIRAFRRMGCTLPIEIMYLGEEDLGEEFRVMLEEIPGVITRDLSIMVDDQGWELKGWAMKPWAVLMSSFQEVLFMDADVLFFVDPETLFEDPQYQATGALFFKDRNLGREEKRKWLKKVLPSPISGKVKENRLWTGESGHMQDSGIVVIDKWVHFVPVLLATRLNGIDRDGNSDTGKKGVYEMVYGDKETFWLSWEMAGVHDYAFHSGPTGILGILKEPEAERSLEPDGGAEETDTQEEDQSSRVSAKVTKAVSPQNHTACSPQLLHLGNTGRPLWLNGWISQNKFSAPNDVDIDNFQVFLKEPVKKNPSSKTEMWELEENNVCCLTVDSFTEISKDDKHALEVMILLAKEYEWEV